ncbi:hypothetical protein [Planktothricoides raciborskii]|uniref:Uncharacterized protein n=2 Tax=Planktothricoides raciborskii TaxID=132608 RepID=A0AAU8JGJ3_9CYAN|nr:hypothetical protein [Planktothricoides raciborskii]MBD2545238.1 hypothetical protein [Planktothricoides raciborskii FACHB-1370]MBD2584443.1 hypothetical protein [Planktothricoides raciborskii FACHB-1261]
MAIRPYKRNIPLHYTLHPTPYTTAASPYTLHPTRRRLPPTPYTLHDGGFPLHPTLYTLHPFLRYNC